MLEPTFVIHYGIHAASRLVVVREVRLNPYSELARRITGAGPAG